MNFLVGKIFYGQNKLLGVPLIQILHKSIKKKDEPLFYTIIQDIIALTEGEIDSLTLQDIRERAKSTGVITADEFIKKLPLITQLFCDSMLNILNQPT
ncbi:MAG TPA: hypothetical protein VFF20_09850 [Pseudogracilibacillus sp.]|nr:hypothetical protein [Pseudogracilibacillus sp.]